MSGSDNLQKIFRGFPKKITFTMKDSKTRDPIPLHLATEIKACLQDVDLTLTGGGITNASGIIGKAVLSYSESQTSGFAITRDVIEGFVQFSPPADPIPFEINVDINDIPCT